MTISYSSYFLGLDVLRGRARGVRGVLFYVGGALGFGRTYLCVKLSEDRLCGLTGGKRVPRCEPSNGLLCFGGRRLSR